MDNHNPTTTLPTNTISSGQPATDQIRQQDQGTLAQSETARNSLGPNTTVVEQNDPSIKDAPRHEPERPKYETLGEELDAMDKAGHSHVANLLRDMAAIREKWYPLGA